VYELIKENDTVVNTKLTHARRQAVAIDLALISHKVGMSRAENHIHGVRAGFDDSGHGIEHGFDALVRRQETKRKNDRLAGKPEFRFGMMGFNKGKVRYSVRYDIDLSSWRLIGAP